MSVMLDKLLKGQKVEWLKLGDVAKFVNGRAYKQPELLEQGKYPVLRVGNFFTNANWYYSDLELDADKYADNGDLLYAWSASFGPRIWQGDKVIYHYHIWKVIPNEQKILKKFLYHILEWDTNSLKNEYANGSTMMHITKGTIEQRLMPIPPLDVQAEIVRILDAFTALTAELTMRAKQYHYYRDKLLTFSDDVEWKRLEEVFNITAGGDVPKNALSPIQTDEFNIPIISNSMGEKSLYGWTDKSRVNEASITISARGANTGWTNFQNRPIFPIIRLLALTPKIEMNLKYAYYFMKMIENNYKISEAGIPQLTVPMIRDIKIPFPNLTEQNKIANILDKFEILTNSITEGLPKEIALRQKQYEYYREQLLDFSKE